jgi:uncharacterized protein (DUF488 family)
MRFYTVGHSARTLPELLALLRQHGVEILVDVRRFPGSRKYPHFSQQSLEIELSRQGIRYLWLGELLGGFRSEGYRKYTETEEFRRGVQQLKSAAEIGVTAVMCAELLWFRCHRRYISEELTKRGFEVVHIIDEKRTQLHTLRQPQTKRE